MSLNLSPGQRWQAFRDRPFARLVRLFTARIFRGSGDNDAEGLDLSIGLVLTLLVLPGGFVSIILFPKYGTLLQWMRGVLKRGCHRDGFAGRVFFHRSVDGGHWRDRCVEMGQHLPRSPRLPQSGAAAHLVATDSSGEFRGRDVSRSSGCG